MNDGIPLGFDLPFPGEFLDIGTRMVIDAANDIVAIPLNSTTLLPDYMRFFRAEKVVNEVVDGASVITLGFPIANSAVYAQQGRHAWKALGLTSDHANFSTSQQFSYTLPSSYDSSRHFIIDYNRVEDGIPPKGMSGSGAWCNANARGLVWEPHPVLVGVVTGWYKKNHEHGDLLKVMRGEVVQRLLR